MGVFTGDYICKLDAKGRLVLPARLKASLPESPSNELYLRKGLENCLVLRTHLEAKKEYSLLANLDATDERVRDFQRAYFRREVIVEMDSAGRILIPKNLLLYAKLEDSASVIGIGTRIEIWNTESLDAREEAALGNYAAMYSEFMGKNG
ncbi:Cell division protein MraZ [Lunatimonas lonarensis]|uniref:Transcriptional regulator MraZ n=1 Tax=Lunatimonas lonarensis TaxID=1232681 RepID=R7ZS77_9BACT|nr:division/cell wall cluster transcriptional repressor MraZ [Lunatimonas lonarensis]EON76903.1 Cell division protein MraZ [Lunatimonas lonarensis]